MFYEIFNNLDEINSKDLKINELLHYPNSSIKTVTYRKIIKHPEQELWAAAIEEDVIELCSGLDENEKLQYYNQSSLYSHQDLKNDGWFTDAINFNNI